jgi:hypothetical protein
MNRLPYGWYAPPALRPTGPRPQLPPWGRRWWIFHQGPPHPAVDIFARNEAAREIPGKTRPVLPSDDAKSALWQLVAIPLTTVAGLVIAEVVRHKWKERHA